MRGLSSSFAIIILLMFFMGAVRAIAQSRENARIVASSVDVQALLGSGYSSQKERFEEGCVTGVPKFSGAQTSGLSFSQVTSQADLASSLGFQVGTRVRYGLVSVSAGAKFFSSSQSTNYSLSAVYSSTYRFKNEILTQPKLSEVGQSVRENDERWLETCGDGYVWQRELGAKFFFSIRIDFASQVDKQYFEANFSLSSPPLDVAAGLQTSKDRLSKRTTVTISALQVGGSVEKLSDIFGGAQDRMAFVQCSMGEFQRCFNVLKTTLDYATDVKNGFPSQISPTLGTDASGGPAVLAYHTRSYHGAGIFERGYPLLNEAVKQSRRDLMLAFEDLYANKVRLQQILYSKSLRQSERQKARLRETESIIEANKHQILDASKICYETPLECPRTVSKLVGTGGSLKPIDPAVFILRPESFAQYCDLARLPEPDPGIRATVDAVIAEARRIDAPAFKASENGGADECSLAEDVINRSRRLSLVNRGLKDLRPLASFTHLEGLFLAGNKITDVSSLSGMTELRELDLGRNQIRDVHALSKLEKLATLKLDDNRIRDASPLALLKGMERLDLRNNLPGVRCPYPEPDRCLTGDFRATNSFVAMAVGRIARAQHTATPLANGRVLFAGGWGVSGRQAEIYDEHARLVPTKGLMREARSGHAAALLKDGRVLVTGGWGALKSAEIYDPASGTFQPVPASMSVGRAGHTMTVLRDGSVLIVGGWSSRFWTGAERDALASVELFVPRDNKFVRVGSLKFRRAEHAATLLPDGKVLVTGGFTNKGALATAEIFDPATKEFHHAPTRMTVGRGAHTATLLPDGNVALIGGWAEDGKKALETAEIFEVATGTFRVVKGEPMRVGRAWHTATLLSDGRVLVAGGMSGWDLDLKTCATCLDSADVFDPSSEMFTSIPKRMSASRVFHTATPLDAHMVLIFGGTANGSARTGDIYEYNR